MLVLVFFFFLFVYLCVNLIKVIKKSNGEHKNKAYLANICILEKYDTKNHDLNAPFGL